jgi:hypothetical protein
VHNLLEVRVIYVREDPEEVLEYVFGGVCEGVGELASWRELRYGSRALGSSPDLVGKTVSSSSSFWSHDMTKSIYVGAGRETRR